MKLLALTLSSFLVLLSIGLPAEASSGIHCATFYVAPPAPRLDNGQYPRGAQTIVCEVPLAAGQFSSFLGWSSAAVARAVVSIRSGDHAATLSCNTTVLGGCTLTTDLPATFSYSPAYDAPQVEFDVTLPESGSLLFTLEPTFPAACGAGYCVSALTGEGQFDLLAIN